MEENNTQNVKIRLDKALHERGLARSRSFAIDMIKRGNVAVNGKTVTKGSVEVSAGDTITLNTPEVFVSRAGEKLDHALTTFDIDVTGMKAVDIGSSTGGFTDCLLKRGASHVTAIDVGTDQLVQTLRNDPRVTVYEGTNVRTFTLPEPVDIAVVDVSFISLTLVLPKVHEFLKKSLFKGGIAVVLVKPQFEVGMEMAKKHQGVITNVQDQKDVLERVKKSAKGVGFKVVKDTISPIEGEKGNTEFLLYLKA